MIIMTTKKSIVMKILFLLLSLVWFFFSFEVDNNAGDLGDTAFRALKNDFSAEIGVSEKAGNFCRLFAVMLVILAVIFVIRFFTSKKSVRIASAAVEFASVLFMTYRFQINNNAFGNITYIPAMLLLLVIGVSDVRSVKKKIKIKAFQPK